MSDGTVAAERARDSCPQCFGDASSGHAPACDQLATITAERDELAARLKALQKQTLKAWRASRVTK